MDNRIIKYFENELSVTERINLLRQMETDEALKEEFIGYRNMLGLLALSEKQEDEYEGQQSYVQFEEQHKKQDSRKKMLRIFSYAASIAVLIIGTYLVTSRLASPDIITTTNTLYVPAGQRANITLSDGTDVWVNANSTIIYPAVFADGERKVELIGEAFFQVAKDTDKPFVVSTDKINVKVLGTTFNVSSYLEEKQANVSLIEGSVEVSSDNEKYVLKPGEHLSYIDGNMAVSKLFDENDFSWRQGIYTFNQVPLSQIVEKLELYYDVKIIVKNTAISKELFTGKFRQRDGIMEILKILQKVHPFRISKDEQNNVITIE